MNGNPQHWDSLVVDSAATPLPLSNDRFREWMGRQRLFVSSVMDAELNPYREALRGYLHREGAAPVMWEEIAPQDATAERAFLDGVESSTVFVLMLGNRYGVSDASGYSPTHKEANRAKDLNVTRLMFTLPDRGRDGRLNDWLRSLHNEISALSVDSPQALVVKLGSTLRDIAARSERNWIKLGRLVFPGKVKTQASANAGQRFTVVARPASNAVRNALLSLGRPHGGGLTRLTWPNRSYPVQMEQVSAESEFVGDEEVEVVCRTPQNWYGESGIGGAGITFMSPGGRMGPDDLAQAWVKKAMFGDAAGQPRTRDALGGFAELDAPTLPQVLQATKASGWLAEGLVRLYAVEEVARYQAGYFTRLEVGPATARGVRIVGEFEASPQMAAGSYKVPVQGTVPLIG
jgi:hypothetical protein